LKVVWKCQKFIEFGFYISLLARLHISQKNGKGCNYEEVIKNIPLDMILTDTDSPMWRQCRIEENAMNLLT